MIGLSRKTFMTDFTTDLQNQYTVYKNTLQQIAQKIGDVEQEAEEHKYVTSSKFWGPLGLLVD